MNTILGISASGGMGIGKAFILPKEQERSIPHREIQEQEIAHEWKRFDDACSVVQGKISDYLKTISPDNLQHTILETYLLMLSDPVFIKEVKQSLEKSKQNLEYVLDLKVKEYTERLRNSGNEYLSERASDIEDVFGRVQDFLLGYHKFNYEEIPEGAIVVADSMKAGDTVILFKRNIEGLALTEGGVSSHVAILAKSYGIPAVVGLEGITNLVTQNESLIIDGTAGEVILSPDNTTLRQYQIKIAAEEKYIQALKKFRSKKAITEDGTEFKLYANIGTPEEAQIALDEGADGIGLFRTEFLFMRTLQKQFDQNMELSSKQSEDLQFEAYKQVLSTMGERPVTIRTLDAGGDKLIDSVDMPTLMEKNPLMGLRAIRQSLFYPRVFRTQLRALYRASVYGNLRIMLPLITDVSQVETVLGIARGVRESLRSEGIPIKEDVPIGIMIETAAAAICSDCLAPHSAFFSLGTNDLTQYIIGIDRENPAVAPFYNEFHLAVLRMIKLTIANAHKTGIPISVCGEMAGRKESAIILAGMGIRALSMTPKQIPIIKETLSQFTIQELENISSRSIA